ncbi:hypothetical protein KR009_007599, partial [Drosophila setifemur]
RSSRSARRSNGVIIDETESDEQESEESQSGEDSEESESSTKSKDSIESEEEVVRPKKTVQRNRLRPPRIISDSEEEDELDQRALSPSTRMSITGVRPQDLSDGDSEIEYSNEGGRDDDGDDDDVEREERNIEEALHSTLFPVAEDAPVLEDSGSSDVLILSNKEVPIEISSSSADDDIIDNKENMSGPPFARPSRSYSPRSSAGAQGGKTAKILSQPTIMSALQPLKTRLKSEGGSIVSQEYHQKELLNLSKLRVEMTDAEKLFEKVAHKLPDKGSQIKKRIDGLRTEIEAKTQMLSTLQVEQQPSKVPTIKVKDFSKPAGNEWEWDDLSAAVNQIKPVHTGTQGMATFNNQKAMTLDSLKGLHGSLKDCPGPNVLAEDPKGLKVTLMEHQKHALAWMAWREQQSPRGGILADDMGLGKTLTMISSVLACKNRQGSGEGDEPESTDDEGDPSKKPKSTGGWSSKGRKDFYKGGTLVVCPASLLRQWEGEVQSKVVRHGLTVCVHHGNNRETKGKHLRTYDIVVTTYQIVAREFKELSALFGVKWRRIILDEAHVVRNHKSQSSLAVCELKGKYRWALTGTPIQNKELDVYALLKFLRCTPFDDLNTWKKWIDNKSAGGQNRLNLLMKSLMLRRTKVQLQMEGKLNSLPNKELRLIEISLDKDEMNVYQMVMTYSRTLFAQFLFQRAEKDTDSNFISDANKPTYNQMKDPNGAYYKMHEKFSRMAGGKKTVKSHEILVLLLRLRQICCHPGLIDAMLEGGEESTNMETHSSDSDSPEIDLLAQLNKLAITDTDTANTSNRSSRGNRSGTEALGIADGEERPLRGEEARIAKVSKNLLKRSNPVFNLSRPSSKMLKVIDILTKAILKSKDDKAIVVSQWTSVLDILRDHLERTGVHTLSLNGAIPVKNRQDIVNQFNDQLSPKRVLLLSLTAGGVGLNLIGANHLLLLDLHWNPQLEAQAQDRIYRVGQKKDVIIYKFMCADTVEQRIKALQDKKLELANGVLTGAAVSSKLTMDDLKGLFGL